MGAGFCSLYCEIHYIEVRYIEVWVYLQNKKKVLDLPFKMALKWFHKKVNLHWIIWMVSVCVGVQNIKNSAFSMQIISIYLKTYFIIIHAVCIYWEGEAINLNSGKNIYLDTYLQTGFLSGLLYSIPYIYLLTK